MTSSRHRLPQTTPAPRGGPIRWLILGGVLLIAAIAVGATVMAGNFRERALHNAERELENTVLLLARHFDQQLEDFEVVQKDLIDFMRVQRHRHARDTTSGRCRARHPPDAEVEDERAVLCRRPQLFDADGRLINASTAWPVPAGHRRRPRLFPHLQVRPARRRK